MRVSRFIQPIVYGLLGVLIAIFAIEPLSSQSQTAAIPNLVASTAINGSVPYIAVVNPDGSTISGGAAGTQYTEGDTDATIVGTALLWEDAGDTLATVSASSPLPVNVDNSSFNVVTTSAIGFGATAAAVPAGAVYTGANVGGNLVGVTGATEGSITGLYTLLLNPATNAAVVYNSDPCQTGTKVFLPFQGTADAELITGTASNRTYICHIHLTVAGDMDVALISGTGSVCATSTGAIFGGTAAASGWQFVDSRGISIGDGGSAVGKTDTDADNVCIDVSAATQFSGVIVYVVAAA